MQKSLLSVHTTDPHALCTISSSPALTHWGSSRRSWSWRDSFERAMYEREFDDDVIEDYCVIVDVAVSTVADLGDCVPGAFSLAYTVLQGGRCSGGLGCIDPWHAAALSTDTSSPRHKSFSTCRQHSGRLCSCTTWAAWSRSQQCTPISEHRVWLSNIEKDAGELDREQRYRPKESKAVWIS